jgi:hypothetical protein
MSCIASLRHVHTRRAAYEHVFDDQRADHKVLIVNHHLNELQRRCLPSAVGSIDFLNVTSTDGSGTSSACSEACSARLPEASTAKVSELRATAAKAVAPATTAAATATPISAAAAIPTTAASTTSTASAAIPAAAVSAATAAVPNGCQDCTGNQDTASCLACSNEEPTPIAATRQPLWHECFTSDSWNLEEANSARRSSAIDAWRNHSIGIIDLAWTIGWKESRAFLEHRASAFRLPSTLRPNAREHRSSRAGPNAFGASIGKSKLHAFASHLEHAASVLLVELQQRCSAIQRVQGLLPTHQHGQR